MVIIIKYKEADPTFPNISPMTLIVALPPRVRRPAVHGAFHTSTASHTVDTNQVRLYDMQIGFVDGLEVWRECKHMKVTDRQGATTHQLRRAAHLECRTNRRRRLRERRLEHAVCVPVDVFVCSQHHNTHLQPLTSSSRVHEVHRRAPAEALSTLTLLGFNMMPTT